MFQAEYDQNRQDLIDMVDQLWWQGVNTFVVGFGATVDSTTLNELAVWGGTADWTCASDCYFQADDQAGLTSALQQVAVVVHGLMREHFVMSDGTERTKAFVPEGHPTGSLADVLSAVPSRAFIVAEEPTRVLVANFADTLALAEHCEGFRRYGERLTQRVLLVKAEREYELLGLDAQARYQAFLSRYPGLEARVAARHVASYLGITPVHLSRLRRRRRSEHAVGKAHTTTQTG